MWSETQLVDELSAECFFAVHWNLRQHYSLNIDILKDNVTHLLQSHFFVRQKSVLVWSARQVADKTFDSPSAALAVARCRTLTRNEHEHMLKKTLILAVLAVGAYKRQVEHRKRYNEQLCLMIETCCCLSSEWSGKKRLCCCCRKWLLEATALSAFTGQHSQYKYTKNNDGEKYRI
jgi:hypothetical protein